MRADGITCPTCGMTRAPSLPTCPRCRPVEEPRDVVEASLLDDDGGGAHPTNLPSRVVLASVPLLWCVMLWLSSVSPHAVERGLSYTELGWVSSAIAIVGALALCLPGAWLATRAARRLSIAGQRPSGLVIGLVAVVGVAPLVGRFVYRTVESVNTRGLAGRPGEPADCRWTVARQQLSERGTVTHVTVAADCALASGERFDVDIGLESASEVAGERLTVPTWPGHVYGRLVALAAHMP